jgi:hypothetical protein
MLASVGFSLRDQFSRRRSTRPSASISLIRSDALTLFPTSTSQESLATASAAILLAVARKTDRHAGEWLFVESLNLDEIGAVLK